MNGEASSQTTNLPWLLWLDEEIKGAIEEDYTNGLCVALKDFLLSTSDTAAADTALRVDALYKETLLDGDPLLKFQDDKGISGFLNTLWEIFFEVAKRVPYSDSEQHKLLQFINELRKLSPKPFNIWKSECLVYSKEPVFFSVINRHWNHNSVQDIDTEDCTGPELKAYKEDCDQWVNFSAFLARCTASGLDRNYEDPIPYPSRDLEAALEENHEPGLKRDYTILAAAQYILLADRTLYEDFIGKGAEGSKRKTWGLKKWPLWNRKFAEAAAEYEANGRTELAEATKKANDKMASYPL